DAGRVLGAVEVGTHLRRPVDGDSFGVEHPLATVRVPHPTVHWGVFEKLPVAAEADIDSVEVDLLEEVDPRRKPGANPAEVGGERLTSTPRPVPFRVEAVTEVPGARIDLAVGVDSQRVV